MRATGRKWYHWVLRALFLHQVDAFADEPFSGNPAAVCVLDAPRDEQWMRSVAAEMNLSETAYLVPEGDAWRLRWAAKLGKDEKLAGEAVTVLRAELMVE